MTHFAFFLFIAFLITIIFFFALSKNVSTQMPFCSVRHKGSLSSKQILLFGFVRQYNYIQLPHSRWSLSNTSTKNITIATIPWWNTPVVTWNRPNQILNSMRRPKIELQPGHDAGGLSNSSWPFNRKRSCVVGIIRAHWQKGHLNNIVLFIEHCMEKYI